VTTRRHQVPKRRNADDCFYRLVQFTVVRLRETP
jgi:hypothetical protein